MPQTRSSQRRLHSKSRLIFAIAICNAQSGLISHPRGSLLRNKGGLDMLSLNLQGHALFTRHAGGANPCPQIDFTNGFNEASP